jgi:hypothetical protein
VSTPRQDEFGGGIFRSPRAPAGCVYDCVNGLVDDELAIYRRGGVGYRSNADVSGVLTGVADGLLPTVGARTLLWSSAVNDTWMLSPGDDATPQVVAIGACPQDFAKAVGVWGLMAFPVASPGYVALWGGSRLSSYSTGTVTVTSGSQGVTGVGSAWLGNVDPGMILTITGGAELAVVESVSSNTALRLRAPWQGATQTGVTYALAPYYAHQPGPLETSPVPVAGTFHVASVGSGLGRLVVTSGNRAYFSSFAGPFVFDATDYHEVPPPAQIVGADSVRDTLVLFTTSGVWAVSNMNMDLTDSSGNPQQTLEQVNKDLVAWSNSGIAGFGQYAGVQGWAGQFVVPALDDVYVFGLDSPAIAIGRGIRALYKSYVAAGYRPGGATVYRGHYILPIVNGTTPVDVLVCRLDQRDRRGALRPAWTRWSGQAMGVAFTGRTRATSQPSLVAARGLRLVDATSCFVPDAAHKADADGTTHALDVIENDVELANRSTTQKVDLLYELQDAAADNPTIVGSWASGAEGSTWTGLSGSAAENDGRVPKRWRLTKRVRNVRFRWQTVGPAAVARIRGRVLYVRDSNRP